MVGNVLCSWFSHFLLPPSIPSPHTPAAALTDLDTTTINKLLTALNECTEWGQVFILDSLATYQPQSEQEAQNICERVTPRLSHANAAVVLSAVKVLMKFMEIMSADSQYYGQLIKKLAPPLGEFFPQVFMVVEFGAVSSDPAVC